MVCLQRFGRVNWGRVQREWTSQLGGHWEFRELWGAGGPVQARLWVPLGSLGGAAGRAWRSDCWLGGPTSHHMASLSPARRQFLSPRAQPRLSPNPRPSRPRWLSHRDLRLHVAELEHSGLSSTSPPTPSHEWHCPPHGCSGRNAQGHPSLVSSLHPLHPSARPGNSASKTTPKPAPRTPCPQAAPERAQRHRRRDLCTSHLPGLLLPLQACPVLPPSKRQALKSCETSPSLKANN